MSATSLLSRFAATTRNGDLSADAIAATKRHILDYQSPGDWQVLSADNEVTAAMNTPSRTLWFSTRHEPHGDGAWLDEDGNLHIRISPLLSGEGGHEAFQGVLGEGLDAVICHRRNLLLMGEHNVMNVLAASAVCACAGAPVEAMRQIATTFRGVAHRLQLIRDESGVEHFFHRSAVRGAVFELLREGQRVEFATEDSPKGPRAADVRLLDS